MLKNLNLSTKILLVVIPLFAFTFAAVVYLNYRFEEQQTLELARIAADAQASVIKKSLVHMMTTSFAVDDKYLAQIARPGELENVRVIFKLDSLHLDPMYLKQERIPVLRERESNFQNEWNSQMEHLFATGDSLWIMTCDVSKHSSPEEKHSDFIIEAFSSGLPFRFWSCARLRIVLPFRAEAKCLPCHGVSEGFVLGAASMELPLGQSVSAIRSNAIRSFIIFVVLTAAVAMLGTFIFRTFIGKPIRRLVEATEIIGTGNLDHKLVEEFSKDELGRLASSFEAMQDKLKLTQSELLKKERLSTIGQMASSIIHDFRNPLTNISLGLSMLETNTSMPAQRRNELFEQTRNAIHRITQMTQELLEFSRGEIRLEKRPSNISDVANEVATLVREDMSKRSIQFTVDAGCSRVCFIDKERLQRALVN
ncbi:MAG: hypothetical protein HW374_510, partial [Bacteroidetes bacterium]|nr:hypothetical protein [Bacteroidota bacterium]